MLHEKVLCAQHVLINNQYWLRMQSIVSAIRCSKNIRYGSLKGHADVRRLTSRSSWHPFRERVSMPNILSGSSLLYLRALPLPTFRVPPRPQYTITFFRLSSCSSAFFPKSGSLSAENLRLSDNHSPRHTSCSILVQLLCCLLPKLCIGLCKAH